MLSLPLSSFISLPLPLILSLFPLLSHSLSLFLFRFVCIYLYYHLLFIIDTLLSPSSLNPTHLKIDEDQFTATGGLSPNKPKQLKANRLSQSRDRDKDKDRDGDSESELDTTRDRNRNRRRKRGGTRDRERDRDGDLEGGNNTDDAEQSNRDSDRETERENNRPLITGDLLDATKVREKMRARTFVEVHFQENVSATTSMEGGAPLWKQSLSLPFRAPQDDYTPDSLGRVRDNAPTVTIVISRILLISMGDNDAHTNHPFYCLNT